MIQSPDIEAIARKYHWPSDEQSMRVLGYIVSEGLKRLEVRKIILYGSRARGDHNKFSDFDVAFDLGGENDEWTRFFLDVEENLETLLDIDLVELNSIGEKLRTEILRDGVLIYENK